MRLAPRIIGSLLAATCLVGCSSNRISMTPAVTMAQVPENNSTFYRVQDVALSFYGPPPSDWKGKGFANQFTRVAQERYPGLFKADASAIPITVRVETAVEVHDGPALLVFVGTLGILGGALPSVPWSNEWRFTVRADDVRGSPILSTNIEADHSGWWSLLSPCGLITVPGESDIPKRSTVIDGGPGSVPLVFRNYMVQCTVDQLATELLKCDGRSMPGIPPSSAGTPPSGQPTALPPPTNALTPF